MEELKTVTIRVLTLGTNVPAVLPKAARFKYSA